MKTIKKITYLIAILLFTSCGKEECINLPCGGSNTNPMVDLIILIDCSGSMSSVANDISNQADTAISLALQDCPSDLRVTWLGLDGTWIGTKFITNHKTYLTGLGVTPLPANNEQGAIAIQDLSNNFDWRPGSCRAIFYISDEPINSNFGQALDDSETIKGITEANNNSVTVSANFLGNANFPTYLANYQKITSETGGQLFNSSNPLPANYYIQQNVFNSLVCNACNNCQINIQP